MTCMWGRTFIWGRYSKNSKNVLTYVTTYVRTPELLRTRLRQYANRLECVLTNLWTQEKVVPWTTIHHVNTALCQWEQVAHTRILCARHLKLPVTRRWQASWLKEFKVVCGGASQPPCGYVLVTCEGSRQQKFYLVIAGPSYKYVHTAGTCLNKLIFKDMTCNFSFIRLTHIN